MRSDVEDIEMRWNIVIKNNKLQQFCYLGSTIAHERKLYMLHIGNLKNKHISIEAIKSFEKHLSGVLFFTDVKAGLVRRTNIIVKVLKCGFGGRSEK